MLDVEEPEVVDEAGPSHKRKRSHEMREDGPDPKKTKIYNYYPWTPEKTKFFFFACAGAEISTILR